MAIHFFFEDNLIKLSERRRLKEFISNIFQAESVELESLFFIFCTDERLLSINKQFLLHDYYTDIITFNLTGKNEPVKGEVFISIDRIKDNALHIGVEVSEELHRVIFHGVLHLCGYKDKTRAEKKEMTRREDDCLNRYLN